MSKAKYSFFVLIIIISGLLCSFLYRDDLKLLINRNNVDSKLISDFSNVYTNDCIYNGNGKFQVTGTDPYFVITGFDSYLNEIVYTCDNTNFKTISVYYDLGTGFSEQNSVYVPSSNITNIKLSLYKEIKNIRFDFEDIDVSSNNVITVNSISFNKHNKFNFLQMIIIFILNITILSICYYLIDKNNKLNTFIFSFLQCIINYYVDKILIHKIPLHIKIIVFVFAVFLDMMIITITKEVNKNKDEDAE